MALEGLYSDGYFQEEKSNPAALANSSAIFKDVPEDTQFADDNFDYFGEGKSTETFVDGRPQEISEADDILADLGSVGFPPIMPISAGVTSEPMG